MHAESPDYGVLMRRRAPMLDVLRIMLCIGVVWHHYLPEKPASGSFMVNGFFVLSGFLLYVGFIGKKQLDVCSFYVRKSVRFLPLFLLAIACGFIQIHMREFVHSGCMGDILPPFTVQEWGNFHLVHLIHFYDGPAWFMVVEFHMLLIAPFLFVISKKRVWFHSFFFLMAAVSAALYTRVPYKAALGEGLYFSSVARCWQFLAGMVAADVYLILLQKGLLQRHPRLVKVLTFVCILAFLAAFGAAVYLKQDADLHGWNYTFDYNVLCVLLYMMLIPALAHFRPACGEICGNRLQYVSALTYPVYLFHTLVYWFFVPLYIRLINADWNGGSHIVGGISVMVTIAVSVVAMRLQKAVERYFAH